MRQSIRGVLKKTKFVEIHSKLQQCTQCCVYKGPTNSTKRVVLLIIEDCNNKMATNQWSTTRIQAAWLQYQACAGILNRILVRGEPQYCYFQFYYVTIFFFTEIKFVNTSFPKSSECCCPFILWWCYIGNLLRNKHLQKTTGVKYELLIS